MKSISWDFCEHQGEIMHKRDQCRPCWPGVSDIGHRAGTGFPENSTKWEEDLPHLTTHCAFSPWISSVQSLSCVRVFATLWTAARQTSLSIYIYSCLENSMDRKAGRLQSLGSQTVGHDWASNTSCKRYFKGRVWEQKHISTKWEGPVQFLLSLKVAQTVKD